MDASVRLLKTSEKVERWLIGAQMLSFQRSTPSILSETYLTTTACQSFGSNDPVGYCVVL
jgi:hypothetical protein